MRITIFMGSPRSGGNTAAMAKAFEEGAKKAGHDVTILNVGSMKISGCRFCNWCHTKGGGKCVQKDDMQEVYEILKGTDMLVFASPIYYFTMSAQIQAAIQRFFCIERPESVKQAFLLLSSESDGVYDAAKAQYRDMLSYMGIEDKGVITAHGAENKSEEKLSEIRRAAESL